MKQKATITIEGDSEKDGVVISVKFNPSLRDDDKMNLAAGLALKMLTVAKSQGTSEDEE